MSLEKAVDEAADEFAAARWQSGEPIMEGLPDAAGACAEALIPKQAPSPRSYIAPIWPVAVWLGGNILPLIIGGGPTGNVSLQFGLLLGWGVLMAIIYISAKSIAETKNVPFEEWKKVWDQRNSLHRDLYNRFRNRASHRYLELSRVAADERRKQQEAQELEEALRRPQPVPECTHQEAEALAARWMRHLGDLDAVVSQPTRDGGIDVESSRFVAEVKHHAMPIGPAPVRALFGVAASKKKEAAFFSRKGYTKAAAEFGRSTGTLLFVYDPERGTLHGVTALSKKAIMDGLGSVLPMAND